MFCLFALLITISHILPGNTCHQRVKFVLACCSREAHIAQEIMGCLEEMQLRGAVYKVLACVSWIGESCRQWGFVLKWMLSNRSNLMIEYRKIFYSLDGRNKMSLEFSLSTKSLILAGRGSCWLVHHCRMSVFVRECPVFFLFTMITE